MAAKCDRFIHVLTGHARLASRSDRSAAPPRTPRRRCCGGCLRVASGATPDRSALRPAPHPRRRPRRSAPPEPIWGRDPPSRSGLSRYCQPGVERVQPDAGRCTLWSAAMARPAATARKRGTPSRHRPKTLGASSVVLVNIYKKPRSLGRHTMSKKQACDTATGSKKIFYQILIKNF